MYVQYIYSMDKYRRALAVICIALQSHRWDQIDSRRSNFIGLGISQYLSFICLCFIFISILPSSNFFIRRIPFSAFGWLHFSLSSFVLIDVFKMSCGILRRIHTLDHLLLISRHSKLDGIPWIADTIIYMCVCVWVCVCYSYYIALFIEDSFLLILTIVNSIKIQQIHR